MPIDPTEPATTNGTDRRAFLTRSAAGGALVATVATTGLTGLGLGTAAAQEGSSTPQTIVQEYAAKAVALELSASVAYESALSDDALSDESTDLLRQFQRNHQGAASTLTARLHPDAPPPIADPAVVARFSPAPGTDEAAALSLLASLEEALSATHLDAVSTFDDSSFAKTVSQVLAVEEQQAVALARAGGASIEELTPATASTDGALELGQPIPEAETDGDDADDAN